MPTPSEHKTVKALILGAAPIATIPHYVGLLAFKNSISIQKRKANISAHDL
jgi:hypothetical protein